jgi:hypothetical protein
MNVNSSRVLLNKRATEEECRCMPASTGIEWMQCQFDQLIHFSEDPMSWVRLKRIQLQFAHRSSTGISHCFDFSGSSNSWLMLDCLPTSIMWYIIQYYLGKRKTDGNLQHNEDKKIVFTWFKSMLLNRSCLLLFSEILAPSTIATEFRVCVWDRYIGPRFIWQNSSYLLRTLPMLGVATREVPWFCNVHRKGSDCQWTESR